MFRAFIISLALTALVCHQSWSALVVTQYESATPAIYQNGGGSGFGGTLGNSQITMDVQGSNLVVGFVPGAGLNDIVALFLDSKTGGFLDAQMDDQADGSRRALSNLTPNGNDVYPSGVLPDFGITFGNFGTVVFQLNAGNTPGHLGFISFTGTVGQASIPLALLGNPAQIDFFAGYTADSGFNSNESLPSSMPLNGAGNPGFGDGSPRIYENHNRFVTTAIPEASTLAAWSLFAGGCIVASVIRRKTSAKVTSTPRN
jgi:hypothetical protein